MKKFIILLLCISLLSVSCFALGTDQYWTEFPTESVPGQTDSSGQYSQSNSTMPAILHLLVNWFDGRVKGSYGWYMAQQLTYMQSVWGDTSDIALFMQGVSNHNATMRGWMLNDIVPDLENIRQDIADINDTHIPLIRSDLADELQYLKESIGDFGSSQVSVPDLRTGLYLANSSLDSLNVKHSATNTILSTNIYPQQISTFNELTSFHTDFNALKTYIDTSSAQITFQYFQAQNGYPYLPTRKTQLVNASNQDLLIYGSTVSDSRYLMRTYNNANLSLFDRLTVMSNNQAMLGTMIFTPNTIYLDYDYNYSGNTITSSSRKVLSLSDWFWSITKKLEGVNRLVYMFADDDDIAIKNDTSNQRVYIKDQYSSGGSAPSSTDMSNVNDSVGAFSQFLNTGNTDLTGALNGASSGGGYDFWTQTVSDDINIVHDGTRGMPPLVVDMYSSNWENIVND